MFHALQPSQAFPYTPISPQSLNLPGHRDLSSLSMQNLEDKTLPPLSHAIPAEFRSSIAPRLPPSSHSPACDKIEQDRLTSTKSLYPDQYNYEREQQFPSMVAVQTSTRQELAPVNVNSFQRNDSYSPSGPPSTTPLTQFLSRHDAPRGSRDSTGDKWASPPADGQCKWCVSTRPVVQQIVSSLLMLDMEVNGPAADADGLVPKTRIPEVARDGPLRTLQWVLENIQTNTRRWKDGITRRKSYSVDVMYSTSDTASSAKRKFSTSELEDGDAIKRSRSVVSYEAPHNLDEGNKSQHGLEQFHGSYSPHRTVSSSDSTNIPLQSPRQRMLPSPSSTHFSSTLIAAQYPSVSTNVQSSAYAAHFQELQHQVSIKTLALQTLQREYDSLIQKLERQRTKCAALEKKFEVSDAEINNLTDERERVLLQVVTLELQIEQLQQSRDEARKQSVANKGQYMKIIESASRLQAQGAADKRKWDTEKKELEAKIAILEQEAIDREQKSPGTGKDTGEPPLQASPDDSAKPAAESITITEQQAKTDSATLSPPSTTPNPSGEESMKAPIPSASAKATSQISAQNTIFQDFQALILESNDLQAMGYSLSKKGANMQKLLEQLSHGTAFAEIRASLPHKAEAPALEDTIQT